MHWQSLTSWIVLLSALVVPATAQERPAEPPPAVTIARLRRQVEALLVASVLNARSRGQGTSEFGASIAWAVAPSPSWARDTARDTTPQAFARGMRATFRLLGLEAHLPEDTPDLAVVRFSRPDSTQFHMRYGAWGATLADYDETIKAAAQQLAAERGLVWDQRRDGTWMVARITRDR